MVGSARWSCPREGPAGAVHRSTHFPLVSDRTPNSRPARRRIGWHFSPAASLPPWCRYRCHLVYAKMSIFPPIFTVNGDRASRKSSAHEGDGAGKGDFAHPGGGIISQRNIRRLKAQSLQPPARHAEECELRIAADRGGPLDGCTGTAVNMPFCMCSATWQWNSHVPGLSAAMSATFMLAGRSSTVSVCTPPSGNAQAVPVRGMQVSSPSRAQTDTSGHVRPR